MLYDLQINVIRCLEHEGVGDQWCDKAHEPTCIPYRSCIKSRLLHFLTRLLLMHLLKQLKMVQVLGALHPSTQETRKTISAPGFSPGT